MKTRNLAWLLLGMAPGGLHAAGYYLPNQDAFATARGNAWVATADSAAAVHYNPAGMTQLQDGEFVGGAYGIVLGTEADVAGVDTKAKDELQVAPHLYYARPLNDRFSYGFGLNSPFGLGTEWGRDVNFATVVTEARLTYLSGTAAGAYKITDQLAVGASVSMNYADLTLENGLGLPNSYLRFTGDDIGFSGGLSLRWQPHEQHAFGLVYSTESSFELDGRTSSNVLADDSSAGMDFMTPARVAAGYSYRPAPGWNIEANIEWLNWDELNSLKMQTSSVPGTSEVTVPFEWESSFIYELGASYTTEQGYVFAAGYDYNENSQPDKFFNPAVADADRHWFNVGFGRDMGWASWMLTYQFGYSNRTVDDAINPLANGDYESRHNALVFTWRQEF